MNEKKKKIIIAEDDADLLSLLVKILQDKGYEVLGLPDGTLIMEDHCTSPDLFILDKDMPYYNGVTITRHLRKDQNTLGVPILMVSADEQSKEATDAGVNHYIIKPIQQGVFLTAIQKMLTRASA